jgi:hypothetical protein
MDYNQMILLAVVVFALVAIFAFMVYRKRAKVSIKGPGGTGLDLDASDELGSPAPGVKIEDAKSRSGGLTAKDATGRGAAVKKVRVEGDIEVTSEPPEENPKA